MVSYADESGFPQTQLAIVGDNNVTLLNGRTFGITDNSTPQGLASEWLKNGIFEKLKGE